MHKTSIKLMFCKATNIIVEIQKRRHPWTTIKITNSSAELPQNFCGRKTKQNFTHPFCLFPTINFFRYIHNQRLKKDLKTYDLTILFKQFRTVNRNSEIDRSVVKWNFCNSFSLWQISRADPKVEFRHPDSWEWEMPPLWLLWP